MAQRQIARLSRLFTGQRDNRADLLRRECRRRAGTRRVCQAVSNRGCLRRAAPAAQPVTHRLRPNAKLARGLADAAPRRGQQDQLGAFRQLPWRRVRADQAGQQPLMRRGYHDGFGRQTRHRGLGESGNERAIRHDTAWSA